MAYWTVIPHLHSHSNNRKLERKEWQVRNEVSILLKCDVPSQGNSFPVFRGKAVVSTSRDKMSKNYGLNQCHLKVVTLLQFWNTTNLRMAVAEEADDGEVVLVPVLGSKTAPCGDSPPLCTVIAAEGMDAVVGVAAAGWRIRPNAAVLSRLLGLSLFDLCNLCTHTTRVSGTLPSLLTGTTWKAWKMNKQYSIRSGWFVMKTYG